MKIKLNLIRGNLFQIMAEKKRPTRLAKAAKEFNVGMHTIVEFLHKKGIADVEENPNYKLSPEMVEIVAKEFQSEKSIKDEAAKIEIDYKKLHAANDPKQQEASSESDSEHEIGDLFIKDTLIPKEKAVVDNKKDNTITPPTATKAVEQEIVVPAIEKIKTVEKASASPELDTPKPQEQKVDEVITVDEVVTPNPEPVISIPEPQKPIKEKVAPVVEEPTPIPEPVVVPSKEKETTVPEAKAKKEVEKITTKEPLTIETIETSETEPIVTKTEPEKIAPSVPKTEKKPQKTQQEEPVADDQGNVKILGKINLEELNQLTRPPRKSKEEKQRERDERKKKEEPVKKQPTHPSKEAKKHNATPEKRNVKKDRQEPIKKKPAQQPEPQKKETPRREETHITESGDSKPINFMETKVEKLTGPKILGSIELPVNRKPEKKKPVASSADPLQKKKKRKRIHKPGDQKKPGQPHNQTAGKPGSKQTTDPKGKPKKRKEPFKVEVSDEDVQKKISETLKQLESKGKSKASKHRKDKRAKVHKSEQEDSARREAEKNVLKATEFVTVSELATMMNVPATNVIGTCMSLGLFVSINQRLDAETLTLIADEFGYKVEFVSVEVQEAIEVDLGEDSSDAVSTSRHPIVTVMGHVDHGKTSLLDYIRHTNVIAGEAGGITQHIGAYEVTLEDKRKITFLDTPGHEAFTAMRARGAQVTDIAIIVIAADDKVMPQSIEAINHAQAAGVPIVFAINKIDRPGADPEKIKEGLANMNILVEDWGGKYQSQDISAKHGTNIEKLLDKVLLEAEMLELSGHPHIHAKGTVLESALDKGRGYVVNLLVQDGELHVGDMVLAGANCGRVRALYNERNQPVTEAGPSTPVLMLGLGGAPQAGDGFNVLADEARAKKIASKRHQLQREQGIRTQKHVTLDEIGRRIAVGNFKELNIIVKGDVDGSVEALSDSLLKLSNDEVQVNVIHKSVGQITETDVLLATASDAIIIGFQVRPSISARKLAENEQIDIRMYSVIYDAINELKDAIIGMLAPTKEEHITCNLEIRETFKISKVGTIAGCYVLDGTINRNTTVRIIRDGIVVHSGRLGSLKRFKDDVKEVKTGYECGLNIDNFNDIRMGDIIEGFEEIEVKRKM